MAITLTANINLSVSPVQSNSTPLGTYAGTPKITYGSQPTVGQVYANQRTISGTSETLNVLTGLTDAYGQAIDLTTLQVLSIVNLSGSATLTIGGSTDPVLGSDVFTVGPGNCLYIDGAWATSSTVKNLLVTSTASGTTYNVIILGT